MRSGAFTPISTNLPSKKYLLNVVSVINDVVYRGKSMTFEAVCHAKYREFARDFVDVVRNVIKLHRNGLLMTLARKRFRGYSHHISKTVQEQLC